MREGRGDFLRNASRAAGKHKQSFLPSFLGAFIGGVGFGGSLGRVRDIDWFKSDHNIGHLRSCPAIPQKWWKDPTGEETIAKINLFLRGWRPSDPLLPCRQVCEQRSWPRSGKVYYSFPRALTSSHASKYIFAHLLRVTFLRTMHRRGSRAAADKWYFPSSFFWTEKGHQWKSFPRPQRKLHSSENGFFAL